MARMRVYPPEFRAKILELVRSGKNVSAIAREYELARLTITNWLKQDDLDAGRRSDGLTTAESLEVTKLRKRVRELEIERDILKKAAAWFARETDFGPRKVFEFVRAHHAIWPVATQCRVLNVSVSGYYAWLKRPPCEHTQADAALGDALEVYFERSRSHVRSTAPHRRRA